MRALAVSALIGGALLRIAILRVSVPAVDNPWRAWSYHAATRGPSTLYGPRGHTVRLGDLDEPVVYPPLALDELALVGRAHLALNGGRFDNDVALTSTIKGAIVLLDGVLAALIWLAVQRVGGAARGWWAAMAYWLNPAALLMTTLGFIDVLLAIPVLGAVVAASHGRPWLSGALFAAAVMTKPQGVLVAPAVALALWHDDRGHRGRRLAAAAAAAAITAAAITAPLIAAGTTFYMLRSVAVLARHNALSALAFNGWWVVGYLLQAAAAAEQGFRAALHVQPEMMTHSQAMARGFPNPRAVGALVMGAAVLWGLKTAIRARDLALHAALAAFIVDAYFTLSVQVHENHFFLMVPLLAVAAALRPAFAPLLAALSVAMALNLYFVYGLFGDGAADRLVRAAGIDATVLLSVVNCALFGWFCVTLSRAQPRDPAGGCAIP
jgi:hypothetical protein